MATDDAAFTTGPLLVAIPRGKPDRNGKPEEEIRLSLAEFKGHEYLALRVFRLNLDGGYFPVAGKGVSVRLSEAQAIADGCLEGLRRGGQGEVRSAGPAAVPSRSSSAREVTQAQRDAWGSSRPRRRGQERREAAEA
jgi:hypothetical protein